MIKHLSILPLFALLICSACNDSKSVKLPKDDTKTTAATDKKAEDPETRGTTASASSTSSNSTSSSTSSTSSTNPSGAFERKLDTLVTQKAPWGDIEISVQKARELRGAKPDGFPTEAKHSTSSVYAILDLKLESNGDKDNDYKNRDTWDLLLKDGTRVKPLNPVGIVLPPGGTQNVSLFYQVTDSAKLEGSSLEINGSDRNALEPLPIPLDAKTTFASQVKLSDLVGESFEPDDSSLHYEIRDAVYGVNLQDTGRRAARGQRLVELTVRVGYNGDNDQASFGQSDSPLLSVNEHTLSPDAFDAKTIQSGETHDFVLVYPIDESASTMDLVLDSGNQDWMTDVELPSLLDGDKPKQTDKLDNSGDSSNDNVDSSDEDSSDNADSSDDNSDDSADSSDDSADDSSDNSDDSSDSSDDSNDKSDNSKDKSNNSKN